MNLKKLLVAMSLGVAAFSAFAGTLDSVTGNVTIKLGGLTTETNTQTGTNESTWGVGFVESIKSTSNTSKWISDTSDGYLYYMVYGISDLSSIPNGGGFDIYNIGAKNTTGSNPLVDGLIHLDLYRSATQITAIDPFLTANPNGRTGYNSYAAFAALGTPYLALTFGPGIQSTDRPETVGIDESTATLVQTANSLTLPASGHGSFFLDVAGGTSAVAWNTNGQSGHDMSGNFTIRPNFGPGVNCTAAQVAAGTCFAGQINDPIQTAKVALPEPGSLALFGLALAGLAGVRRRKNT